MGNSARRLDPSNHRSRLADLLRRKSVAASFKYESVEYLTDFCPPPIFDFIIFSRKNSAVIQSHHILFPHVSFLNAATESNALAWNKLAYSPYSLLLGLVNAASSSALPPHRPLNGRPYPLAGVLKGCYGILK